MRKKETGKLRHTGRGEEITTISHLTTVTMPLDYVNFTSTSGKAVICSKCTHPPPEGEELYFIHDRTGENPGRYVCGKCRQYYLSKTMAAGFSTRKF